MTHTNFLLTLICFCFYSISIAQTGKVSGTLHDGEYNDVLPFANVSVKGTSKGTTSDFDGDYSLELDEGTYTLVFSFVGYESKAIEEVVIKPDEVFELDVTLNPSAAALDEVMITTTARRNTEESVLNLQKKSVTLMDGLSLQSMKRSGASTIASAVKSVPGVSIQEGKYVYVRGLGDRYTKSILNGMDIPGLDPDKNTIQMDIFPTNILENIAVIKSASADLPADFTGGIVNIITKDFPTKEQIGLSFSTSYNPDMHFNENSLGYEGGGTDFLGFDDGTRKMPISSGQDIPHPSRNDSDLERITRSFNPTMATEQQTSMPDFSLGFNYGNQYEVGKNKLGFIASLDYKNTTEFYEGFENGVYQKYEERDVYDLRFDRRQYGDLATNNVLASVMSGLAYKTERSKYILNVLHIQNGESQASYFDQDTEISNALSVVKDNLEYTQRSVSNILLSGKHTNEDASFTTEWKVSPSLSKMQDKDVRLTTFVKGNNGLQISSDAQYPIRLWRDLEELNLVGKIDFTKKYDLFNQNASLKFGGLFSYKQRDYSITNFEIAPYAVKTTDLNGDPNEMLTDENIWTAEKDAGYYARGNFQEANTFDATQNTGAVYVSNEFRIGDHIRSIVGIRAEQFMHYYTGGNTGDEYYDNEEIVNNLDLFPSANLIYELNDDSNLRMSYSRTTARPSFKEKSVVQIVDLLTGVIFLGDIDVDPTYIDNLDLRYELYGDNAQMLAVSGFYKKFKDPIEVVAFSSLAPNQITPRNSPEADVYGVEFESRKNFGFIAESLQNLSVNLNISLIESQIEMAKGEDQEYQSRQDFARDDETIDDTRQLQGQSPYLVNIGLNYNNPDIGLETGILYNVQGKTLDVVGFGRNPDVFIQPFNNLSFNLSKKFGKNQNSTISLKVENILNDERESLYEPFRGATERFEYRAPGTTFGIGYSLSF